MTINLNNRTQQGFFFLLVAMISAVITTWLAWQWGLAHKDEPIVTALTWTGRLAFAIFLIPLYARPARLLFRNQVTATLMRWRRNAGVCYGAVQIIHIILILMMFKTVEDPPTETAMVIIGGIGIVLAMAMLVTSFDRPTKYVGRKSWKLIHKSGFYVFMFIYFYDFIIEPLMLGSFPNYAVLATLTILGMLLRTWVMIANNVRQLTAS